MIQKNKKRPRWDSNQQSPAPEASALSIRPRGHPVYELFAIILTLLHFERNGFEFYVLG